MKTIFLRFPSQTAFLALQDPAFTVAGETGYPLAPGIEAMRIVGAIYTEGTYDAQGEVVETPVLVPGFHVNVLGELPDAWKPFQITPKNPRGIFGCDQEPQ